MAYTDRYGVQYSDDKKELIRCGSFSDGAYTIIDGCTKIGSWAFRNCKGLTSIVIPSSVKEIGSYAFSYCDHLTSVTIPNSVTSIGDEAFSGCGGLISIVLPDSVLEVGHLAFDSLRELHVRHKNAKYMDNNEGAFFRIVGRCILYVPKGTGEAYRQHRIFSQFKDIIEEPDPIAPVVNTPMLPDIQHKLVAACNQLFPIVEKERVLFVSWAKMIQAAKEIDTMVWSALTTMRFFSCIKPTTLLVNTVNHLSGGTVYELTEARSAMLQMYDNYKECEVEVFFDQAKYLLDMMKAQLTMRILNKEGIVECEDGIKEIQQDIQIEKQIFPSIDACRDYVERVNRFIAFWKSAIERTGEESGVDYLEIGGMDAYRKEKYNFKDVSQFVKLCMELYRNPKLQSATEIVMNGSTKRLP